MIQLGNNCMFCEHAKGMSMTRYVDVYNKLGYIYCHECTAAVDDAIKVWNDKIAFGKANHLKNKLINVRRTSGEIETDWIIDSPSISYNSDCEEIIHCYNSKQDIGKWCILYDIIELNPE
jgi:CRISPR/Cas system CMR-associated protein Cmr5 small subunit